CRADTSSMRSRTSYRPSSSARYDSPGTQKAWRTPWMTSWSARIRPPVRSRGWDMGGAPRPIGRASSPYSAGFLTKDGVQRARGPAEDVFLVLLREEGQRLAALVEDLLQRP